MGVFSRRSQYAEDGTEITVGWDFRLDELVHSAEKGCHFCGFMACRFFDDQAFTLVWGSKAFPTPVACCTNAPRGEKKKELSKALANIREFLEKYPDADFLFVIQLCRSPDDSYSVEKVRLTPWSSSLDEAATKKLFGYRGQMDLEIYALDGGDPAARFIGRRPINVDPASEESILQVQTWIKECLYSHSHCPDSGTSKLPKRVVEILGNDALKINVSQEDASYATLSYCWGGPQCFATTLATVEKNIEGFSMSDLPQTLQDGIILTKRLGLRYIWIDSLCIVQDSTSDKEEEIPKMSQYYKNAYVTICAASASQSTTGFLKVHDECEHHPGTGFAKDLLALPYLCPDGAIGSILFREATPYHSQWEATSHRAWTLQERLLSLRVLIYGFSRLLWQCHTTQRSDGGIEDWSSDTISFDHRRLSSAISKARKVASGKESAHPSSTSNAIPTEDVFEIWHRAVEEYTCRELTFPEDKLPEIAGLAVEVHSLTGDDYVAGLWRTQRLAELTWTTYPNLRLSRPTIYRAPSWSWASIDNKVSFDRLPSLESSPLARIICCNLSLKSIQSLFGEVSDGFLEIEAPILEVDRDVLKEAMRRESMLPAPEGDGADFHRTVLNHGLAILNDRAVRREDWEPPGVLEVLVMWARPWAERDGQRPTWSKLYVEGEWVVVSGLVLGKRDDGNYERAGSINTTKMTRESLNNLESRKRAVTIV